MNIQEILSEYQEHKKITRNEGRQGVENLSKLARGLGYKDTQYFGQFASDGCYGDLIEFLEDNPGCIETIKEWIGDHGCQDWHDSLESELPRRKVKDCYPEGVCPDCGTDIPDDTVEGEECENGNCGHVFVAEHEDDDICGDCGSPLKTFMKESGSSLEEVHGCPLCD